MDCFMLIAYDKPNSLELRMATRQAHVDYLNTIPDAVLTGGPFTDDQGNMCGTMLLYRTTSRAQMEEWANNDPYTKAGLFERVELHPFKWIKNNPHLL